MLAGVVDLKRAGNVAFFTWQAQRFRILEQDVGDCLKSKTSNFWRARCLPEIIFCGSRPKLPLFLFSENVGPPIQLSPRP